MKTIVFALCAVYIVASGTALASEMCVRDSLLERSDRVLSEEQRVVKYAPVLRFTTVEQFLPTMPFFTAFDGVDNDKDGIIDFADLDEIAQLGGDTWIWTQLRDTYAQLPDTTKIRVAAGFYRVRSCSASRVGTIIKSDGPRYHRLRESTRDYLARDYGMKAYEYYFYYVNDIGIKGHPEDIEMFYVFVPDSARFMVMAGAAHSDGDANNVAIIEWDEHQRPPDVQAFVELGGHAMAPDLPPPGQLYRAGFDTNWHVFDSWGVRDVIAMGGGGSLRRFDTWKTETRDPIAALSPNMSRSPCSNHRTYQLVPAEGFFGVNGGYGDVLMNIEDPGFDVEAVKQLLLTGFEGMRITPATVVSIRTMDRNCLDRMRAWSRDGVLFPPDNRKPHVAAAKRHVVTRHSTYVAGSPTVLFKPYLFGSYWPHPFARRTTGPTGDPQLYAGVEASLLPLHQVRSWLNMQGSIRTAVSYEFQDENVALDLGYFTSTARRFTEYVLVGTTFPDWHAGGGFIARVGPWFVFGRSKVIEFRAGIAFWHETDLRFSRPVLELSIASPWGGTKG